MGLWANPNRLKKATYVVLEGRYLLYYLRTLLHLVLTTVSYYNCHPRDLSLLSVDSSTTWSLRTGQYCTVVDRSPLKPDPPTRRGV